MEFQFRKASLGGFHRQDVMDYLEKIGKEHSQQLEALQGRLSQLEADREKLTQLEEALAAAQKGEAEARQEAESLQAKLKGAEGEVTTLRAANKEAQEKIFALTPDAQAYRSVKDRAAGMELEAHVRAQKTIDEAKAQAKVLREEVQKWATQVKSQYTSSRGELDIAVLHAIDDAKSAQKVLESLSQSMGQRDRALELLVAEWTKRLDKK